jgi:hypothetical protein
MTGIDDIGWVSGPYFNPSALGAGRDVSGGWTYAPGQFVVGHYFYTKAGSWQELLFYTRMVSALINLFGIILVFFCLYRLFWKQNDFGSLTFGICLTIFSTRGIIESQQGYNFASTLPIAAAFLLFLTYYPASRIIRRKGFIYFSLLAMVSALTIWFSYQAIVFIAATYLTVCLKYLINILLKLKRSIDWIKHVGVFLLTIFIPCLSCFLLYVQFLENILRVGITGWALMDVPDLTKFSLGEYYLLTFLKLHYFSFIPYFPDNGMKGFDFYFISVGFFFLTLVGLLKYANIGHHKPKNLVCFCVIIILLLAFFGNFLGKFPLGSTRHSYIFFLPILISIVCGLNYLIKKIFKPRPDISKYLIAGNLIIPIFFLISYTDFDVKTRNNYDLNQILDFIKLYEIGKVIEDEVTVDAHITKRLNLEPLKYQTIEISQDIDFFSKLTRENIAKNKDLFPVLYLSHVKLNSQLIQDIEKKSLGIRSKVLANIEPKGSTELLGIINGGNGFFAVLFFME